MFIWITLNKNILFWRKGISMYPRLTWNMPASFPSLTTTGITGTCLENKNSFLWNFQVFEKVSVREMKSILVIFWLRIEFWMFLQVKRWEQKPLLWRTRGTGSNNHHRIVETLLSRKSEIMDFYLATNLSCLCILNLIL
jgi:hypothetical protein